MKMKYALITTALVAISGLGIQSGMVFAQSKPATTNIAQAQTVTTFQTDNYSVRVFRQGAQTRINLFDKNTNQLKLNGAPVKVQKSGGQTNYSTSQGGVSYLISVDNGGFQSVQIAGPNESIQEMKSF